MAAADAHGERHAAPCRAHLQPRPHCGLPSAAAEAATTAAVVPLRFQVLGWFATDMAAEDGAQGEESSSEDEDDAFGAHDSRFRAKLFGVTADGRSVGLTLYGYRPYFYVRVPDQIVERSHRYYVARIPQALRELPGRAYGKVLSAEPVSATNFWGFTDGRREHFLRLTFASHADMRTVAFALRRDPVNVRGVGDVKLALFESNVEPMLRLMHERDIAAAGWVEVDARHLRTGCSELPGCAHLTGGDYAAHYTTIRAAPPTDDIAPFLIAAFDIECNSSHGDFPVAVKTYRRVAADLLRYYDEYLADAPAHLVHARLLACVKYATWQLNEEDVDASVPRVVTRVCFKDPHYAATLFGETDANARLVPSMDDVYSIASGKTRVSSDARVSAATEVLQAARLPPLQGDEIIQVGTTFHKSGETACCFRHVVTLGSCDEVDPHTHTVAVSSERDLLLEWAAMIARMDPDMLTGYNVFGFDFAYLASRAAELGRSTERAFYARLSRIANVPARAEEKNLSSSALGENILRFIAMPGRVLFDLMKIVQAGFKLETWKLDYVAQHFTGQKKNDVSPAQIFALQRGGAADRRVIADYCLQDCALCNWLVMRLEIVANNLGMANVCSVPMEYLFMRGQGVKIFSLVAKQCRRDGFLIPEVAKRAGGDGDDAEDEGYEGALVLEPRIGMYLDTPVNVLDYSSLYPSSMISENISHDTLVIDPAYRAVRGVSYVTVTYDTPRGVCRCDFAQTPERGVLPRILEYLLKQRKATRKRIPLQVIKTHDGHEYVGCYEDAAMLPVPAEQVAEMRPLYTDFQKAVLDGLQNAYKVTANSLYGQMGATTSPLYLKHVAACTTAMGRSLILRAREFMQTHMGADVIYGDTDSLFMIFHLRDENGLPITGRAALVPSIEKARHASACFKPHLKPPHDLEYEKTFWPFIIFAKKRYVGNLYEDDPTKCKRKEMGIVLKRRGNAPIVKTVYGGILDIILNTYDIRASLQFLQKCLADMLANRTPFEELVITKTLKASYKTPDQIAHYVLARRMGERDPGNRPQANDRVSYIYIDPSSMPAHGKKSAGRNMLQGDRIEDPQYAREHGLRPDFEFYVTNQLMQPILQLYALVLEQLPGYRRDRAPDYWQAVFADLCEQFDGDETKARAKYDTLRENEVKELLFAPALAQLNLRRQRMRAITHYFKPCSSPSTATGGNAATGGAATATATAAASATGPSGAKASASRATGSTAKKTGNKKATQENRDREFLRKLLSKAAPKQ